MSKLDLDLDLDTAIDMQRLGDDVRRAQDALLDARGLAPLPLPAPRRRVWPLLASASTAALASAALVLVVVRSTEPSMSTTTSLSSSLSSSSTSVRDVASIVDVHGAPTQQSLPVALQAMATLRIDDGSVVVVDRGRATLKTLALDGGALELAAGRVSMSLPRAPSSSTAWHVNAGPWRVDARAVRVDVAYDNDRLTVRVLGEGEAHVTGADGTRSVVVAGDERAWPEAPTETPLPLPLPLPLPSPSAASASASGASRASTPSLASDVDTSAPVVDATASDGTDGAAPLVEGSDGPSWQELARDDRHAEAMNRARTQGIERLLSDASTSLDDLVLLATSARLAASPDVARAALLAVRERAPGSSDAARAAFFLGVLADRAGDDEQALAFFALYKTEAPEGELAAQAMGRALEVGVRAKKNVVEDARTYLRRWPNGAHAAFATRIVQSSQ